MAAQSDISPSRINAKDVTNMWNPKVEYKYPNELGLHPFGTLENGYAWFCREKDLPENTDSESIKQLLVIERLYTKVYPLAQSLHGVGLGNNSPRFRRNISKSDNIEDFDSGPNRALVNLYMKINVQIRNFNRHKEVKRLERENDGLTVDLLQAIEVANRALLVFSMGDYYAALCKDFKDAKEFTMPSERTKWKFLGYSRFSDIVADYDREQADPSSPRLLTKSFELAVSYTGDRYKDVDQIIGFMRSYGDRNLQVHPVKKFFDEGAADQLRKAILRDYNTIPFLGSGPETDAKKKIVMDVLEQVIKRFYAAWSWEEPGHWRSSAVMLKIQAGHEERNKGKIQISRDEAWEVAHASPMWSNNSTGPNLKKGDRTREKSLADDEAETASRIVESEFKDALAQCAGHVADIPANPFVAAVLEAVKRESKKAIADGDIAAANASMYKKKWERSVEDAMAAKEKAAKKLGRAKEDLNAVHRTAAAAAAELAEAEAENDAKDMKLAKLEGENDAKCARIAQLEAFIKVLES